MNNPYGINEYQWALNMLWEGIGKREFYKSYRKLMQELVDKATPKKVKEIDRSVGYFACPNCKQSIAWYCVNAQSKYCVKCGQALDWSEEE